MTLFRGYVRGVVRVEVTDPADPTPYWLVSARNPQAVVDPCVPDRRARGLGSCGPARRHAPTPSPPVPVFEREAFEPLTPAMG